MTLKFDLAVTPSSPETRLENTTFQAGSTLRSEFFDRLRQANAPADPVTTGTQPGTREAPYSIRDLVQDPSRMVSGAHYVDATGNVSQLRGDGSVAPGQELSAEQKLRSLQYLLSKAGVEVPREVTIGPSQETRTFYLRAKISEYSDSPGTTASGMHTSSLRNGVAMEYDLSRALAQELGVSQVWLRGSHGVQVRGSIVSADGVDRNVPVQFYDTGGLHNPMTPSDWSSTFDRPTEFAADGNPIFDVSRYRAIDVAHPGILPGLSKEGEMDGLIRIDLPTRGPDGQALRGLVTTAGYSPQESLRRLSEWAATNPEAFASGR
jgi:hypothetical protein